MPEFMEKYLPFTLKGIMVSLSALETEISIGSINKELDKAVGFFQINFSKL